MVLLIGFDLVLQLNVLLLVVNGSVLDLVTNSLFICCELRKFLTGLGQIVLVVVSGIIPVEIHE